MRAVMKENENEKVNHDGYGDNIISVKQQKKQQEL